MSDTRTTPDDRLDKRFYEKQWADDAIKVHGTSAEIGQWGSLRCVDRLYMEQGDLLVRWSTDKGVPFILNHFTLCDIKISPERGLSYVLTDTHARSWAVEQQPHRLAGMNIFAWVPYFHEVRWAPRNWEEPVSPRALRVSMCIRQSANPEKLLIDGAEYLSTLSRYRAMWPDYVNHI